MKKPFMMMLLLAVTFLTSEAQKFDRGLSFYEAPVFMPKGQLIFGGTISYQDYSFYDYKFAVLEDMNVKSFSIRATPYIYYSLHKNMAVGLRFSYQRFMARINEVNLALSPDLQLNLADVYNLQHTYYGSISYRYYVPIGQSKVFAFFSDISLNIGAGQGKMMSGTGENVTGTYQKILDLGIDFIPGLMAFISNEVAVEASVGILGLGWKRVRQTTNQVYEGSYESASANFKINLLSINLGIDFVIPVLKDRKMTKNR